jgi:hypothetical protein
MQVSDQGADCRRSLQLIGGAGLLRAGDLYYELLGADGQTIDRYDVPDRHLSFADLVADQWRDLLQDGHGMTAVLPDPRHVLACCQACLLSIRTRTPENPGKLVFLAHL